MKSTPSEVPSDDPTALYFRFFNEIGIIAQLSTVLLENRLPMGLLAPHFAVLNHLTRVGDGRTPQEMASAFQTPKATMTHQVGVLERHGLVESRPNPKDGRSKQVWLTDAGRALRMDTIASFAELVERLRTGSTERRSKPCCRTSNAFGPTSMGTVSRRGRRNVPHRILVRQLTKPFGAPPFVQDAVEPLFVRDQYETVSH